MTSLDAWVARVHHLTARLGDRWPHHRGPLTDIACPPDRPCPPICGTCHQRHRAQRCPCPICQTAHSGECPRRVDPDRLDPPGPGCLTCQILDAHPAAAHAAQVDNGDGLRSPNLFATGGSGNEDTPTEAAAFPTATPAADTLIRANGHRREAEHLLRLAISHPDAPPGHLIADAATELTRALTHLQRLQPAPEQKRPIEAPPGCTSCARVGIWSPVLEGGAGKCDWCYRWTHAHGRWPPIGVVEAHAQGRRLTNRVIDEATRAERRPKTNDTRR